MWLTAITATLQPGAESSDKQTTVVRLEADEPPPKIDGALDDAVWRRRSPISDFHQVRPTAFASPSRKTTVWLTYSRDALYVAARLADEPRAIDRTQRIQGRSFDFDDHFHVVLDTYHNGRQAYFFQVNPRGIRREALIENDAVYDDWTTIWRAAAKVTEDGWVVEMAVPFKSLGFARDSAAWGINFGRVIPRRGEEIAWRSRGRDGWSMAPEVAGDLLGLQAPDQGIGLDVQTGLIAQRTSNNGRVGLEPTVDAFYHPNPSLTVAGTANTDFSSVDVDDRIVNLTRFAVLFPEKRPFFLQDVNIFEFGRVSANGRPFFSRRIGLDDEGRPRDIYGGLKAVVRSGRVGAGVVSVVQDTEGRAEGATAARATVDILSRSRVGLIFTDRRNDTQNNQVVGADLLFRDDRLLRGRLLTGQAWLQSSFDSALGQDFAAGAAVAYPNDRLNAQLSYMHLGRRFEPGLGFVNRTGIRKIDLSTRGRYIFTDHWLRRVDARLSLSAITDLDHRLQTGVLRFEPLSVRNGAADSLTLAFLGRFERLDEPFAISENVVITPGRYRFARAEFSLETSPSRPLSAGARLEVGEFFDGHRFDVALRLDLRLGPVQLDFDYEQASVAVVAGRLVTRVARVGTDFAITPSWAWLNRLQYDTVTDLLSVNSRLRWWPDAGTSVVFVTNYVTSIQSRSTSQVDLIARLTYTWRF